MATVLTIAGSPATGSRTARLLRRVGDQLVDRGHRVEAVEVRSLPPTALLRADLGDPALARVLAQVEQADGVVIGTPIFKASFSGLLKSLLDVLPQRGLAGKTVLPLATGGSAAHTLALDYALRPVLTSMGAALITQGWFVLDRHITARPEGPVVLDAETDQVLASLVDLFGAALDRLDVDRADADPAHDRVGASAGADRRAVTRAC